MPYIITTTYQRRPGPLGTDLLSRHAVATLDEAREYAWETVKQISGPSTATVANRAACESITERGGTIGPLPDGTMIEVKPVSWPWIVGVAEDKGLDTELLYDEGGDLAILAALNEVL